MKSAQLLAPTGLALCLPLTMINALSAAEQTPKLQLIEISAITQAAFGGSSADEEEMEWSQTGAHDPRRDGFDFQVLELSVVGAVDPYFRAEAHLAISEDEGLELEEAFLVTTGLAHGLEVEVGFMLTEFGRYNPLHAHAFAHIDQPLVIGTMFGSEGMRDIGARISCLLPTDHYSELILSSQNGDNETAISFLGTGHHHGEDDDEEEHGARELDGPDDLLWSARWVNGWDLQSDAELQLGLSLAYGPNQHDDHTMLYGFDTVYKWYNPTATDGSGTLSWTTEYIARTVGEEHEELHDWGLVSNLVYDFSKQWQAGFRVDYVELDDHEDEDEDEEHVPAERLRISPLIAWRATEFSKIRLQYNYTDPDEGDAVHSVWIGAEVLIGAHPAHNY